MPQKSGPALLAFGGYSHVLVESGVDDDAGVLDPCLRVVAVANFSMSAATRSDRHVRISANCRKEWPTENGIYLRARSRCVRERSQLSLGCWRPGTTPATG